MKTYKTYQAAKIANPDSVIYKDMYGNFIPYSGGFNIPAGELCDPAKYCMTVEQFLDAGNRFVEDDKFLKEGGEVVSPV